MEAWLGETPAALTSMVMGPSPWAVSSIPGWRRGWTGPSPGAGPQSPPGSGCLPRPGRGPGAVADDDGFPAPHPAGDGQADLAGPSEQQHVGHGAVPPHLSLAYSAGSTASSHWLPVPSPGTSTARCWKALSGAAPCQCFTLGECSPRLPGGAPGRVCPTPGNTPGRR